MAGRQAVSRPSEAREQRQTTRINETHQRSSEAVYGQDREVGKIGLRNPGHFRGDAADSAADRGSSGAGEDVGAAEVDPWKCPRNSEVPWRDMSGAGAEACYSGALGAFKRHSSHSSEFFPNSSGNLRPRCRISD